MLDPKHHMGRRELVLVLLAFVVGALSGLLATSLARRVVPEVFARGFGTIAFLVIFGPAAARWGFGFRRGGSDRGERSDQAT